ncbi:MAG: PEP-CTERM sorting domain-containing protein [Rhodothermia bacterium]
MIRKQLVWLPLTLVWMVCLSALQTAEAGSQSITFIDETVDQTDFAALGYGQAGYYFPQFAAISPVTEKWTADNMRLSVPSWIGFEFDSVQSKRTFSLDAGLFDLGPPVVFGVYSKGGEPNWNSFTLPSGETGLSGAVVDEAADNNSNNSVNRIQLGAGVPSSFLMRIVVDNTNQEHDPAGRLRARGDSDNVDPVDVDVKLTNLTFNGIADVYTFQYDNFVPGDFIKIQLNSGVEGIDPSIGGIMFDVVVPEPSSIALLLLGLVGIFGYRRVERRLTAF